MSTDYARHRPSGRSTTGSHRPDLARVPLSQAIEVGETRDEPR
jgi:hypothetical protein